jgi:hypothetical protein
MRTVNETELKMFGMSPVDYLASQFEGILKANQALVCVINNERTNDKGYLVGIATQNERGYTPTFVVLEEHNYNVANAWVDDANKIIFQRPAKETAMIVLSTMYPIPE